MKIENIRSESLEKDFLITVEKKELEEKKDSWLIKEGSNLSLPGFRKGKVPLALMRSKFADLSDKEVKQELINHSDEQIRKDFSLEKALPGTFAPKDGVDGFVFELQYNIVPDFNLKILPEIEEYEITFGQNDIDKAIQEELRTEAKKTEADVVEADFEVTFDVAAKDKEGKIVYDQKNVTTVIGEDRVGIKGFDKHMIGMKIGEEKSFKAKFPEDSDLAGKTGEFAVTINSIHKLDVPSLDDEFLKAKKFKDMDAYKDHIQKRLAMPFRDMIHVIYKRHMLDLLDEVYNIDVPDRLQQREFEAVWQVLQNRIKQAEEKGEEFDEVKGKTEKELRDEYQNVSKRRIKLGFVLDKFAQENNVKVTEDDLRQAILNEALSDIEHFTDIVNYYTKNQQALNSLRTNVLEDKTIEAIRKKTQIKSIKKTAEEIQEMADAILPGMDPRLF